MEFSLLWAALAGVVGLYVGLWWQGRRDATICVRDLWEIALGAGIVGLGVGRLLAMVRGGVSPLSHPGDILILRGGVDTVGAAVAATAYAAFAARKDLWNQLDALAPAVLSGLAGWHAGCLFRDACLGTASDLPWAVAQSGSDISRHPTEIYAAFLFLAAAYVLARVRLRFPTPGMVSGLALAAAGGVRLVTEPLRPSIVGGPVWWYAAAIVVGLGWTGWTLARSRQPSPG